MGKITCSELYNWYFLTNISVTKSKKIGYSGHVARIVRTKCVYSRFYFKPSRQVMINRPRLADEIEICLKQIIFRGVSSVRLRIGCSDGLL